MWQTASDFIVLIGWLWINLLSLVKSAFAPLTFIFVFLKQFITSALTSPQAYTPLWTFPANIKEIFSSIPYFSVLFSATLISLLVIIGFAIFKLFSKI
jgi:hypothetical protein